MPKLKTSRGTAKRFRLTKKGKVKRGMAGKSHILTKKSMYDIILIFKKLEKSDQQKEG